MNKIKVLQIIPDFGLAGAEKMCENLSVELKKNKNVEIEICSFYDKKTVICERLESLGIIIHYLGKHRGPDLLMFIRLVKLIKKINPNIIHTHRYVLSYVIPAVKLLKLHNTKIIHTLHSIASKETPKKMWKMQNSAFTKKMVYPVAISEKVKDSMSSVYSIPLDCVPVIYNGVPLDKCIIKTNYEMGNRILHVGRFDDVKNHELLIDIFKKISDVDNSFKLSLIGSGPLEEKIKEKVYNLHLEDKVNFLGPQSNCYPFYNENDIFILPSKYEGMPMTIIEAMGTGLAIVCSKVGGIPDMIDDKIDGVLCNTIEEFCEQILKIKNNLEYRTTLGQNALFKSKKFSSELMAKKYCDLYMEVLNEKGTK